MTTSKPECPTGPKGAHDRYSDGTCAYCGDQPTSTPARASEVARAFRDGEALAYARVLAFLAALPADSATKGRDQGRGTAYAVQEITRAVASLAEDMGVSLG